jgi:hypothetical protein
MCKLLWGLVFLVILAYWHFFNRLRNGWLHTVRVILALSGVKMVGRWGFGGKRYRAVTVVGKSILNWLFF